MDDTKNNNQLHSQENHIRSLNEEKSDPIEAQISQDSSDKNYIDFSTEFFPKAKTNITNQTGNTGNVPTLLVNNIPMLNAPQLSYLDIESIPKTNTSKAMNEDFTRIISTKERIEQEDYNIFQGSFFDIVTSQNGSRHMQRVYVNTSHHIFEQIFIELLPQLCLLMVDPYANYFCQKFYSILSQESKLKYLNQLAEGIITIAKSKIGTHSCQTILSLLKSKEEKMIIVQSLKGNILDLCDDVMGVHLIEKVVTCFDEDLIVEVYDTIIANFTTLAQNANGLFVCKKIIAHAKNFSTLARIRDVITENSMMLIKNQYGNYTIQVAIDNWACDLCQPIIKSFTGNFFHLSMEKYSSNVIEKCLEKSDEKQLMNFIEEITKNNSIINLMKNPFGNYVLQKALKLSNGKTKTKLTFVIKKSLEKINDMKLINKWKGILNSTNHLSLNNNLGGGLGKDSLNNSGSLNNSFHSNQSSEHITTTNTKEKLSRSYNNSPLLNQSTMLSPLMANPLINSPLMLSSPFMNVNMPRSPICLSSNRMMLNSPQNKPIYPYPTPTPINQMSPQPYPGLINANINNTQWRFYSLPMNNNFNNY